MVKAVRARIRAWFEDRLPRSDAWLLAQHNLYILPTKAGWGFCVTLLVMLLASINYQLNLGYGLTFLLGGAALVSLHQTHGNLRRLTLRVRAPQPVFAGEGVTLEIVLDNPGAERHGVGMCLYGQRRDAMAWCDVPAQGSAPLHLRYPASARGRHRLPTLHVETHFPLGLFRAWSVWRPAATVLVYPAPEQPAPPLPAGQPTGGQELPARQGSSGEFDGLRGWRRGDSLRQVVWKKVARTGELVSRDSASTAAQSLVLDLAQAGVPDAESRLKRLAAWVLSAERLGLITSNIANAGTPGYKARDFDFAAALKARSEGLGKDQAVSRTTTYRVPVMPSLDGNTVEMATEQTAFAENAVGYQATLGFIRGRVDTITRALKGD